MLKKRSVSLRRCRCFDLLEVHTLMNKMSQRNRFHLSVEQSLHLRDNKTAFCTLSIFLCLFPLDEFEKNHCQKNQWKSAKMHR